MSQRESRNHQARNRAGYGLKVLLILSILIAIFAMAGCGRGSLVGQWEVDYEAMAEREYREMRSNAPRDQREAVSYLWRYARAGRIDDLRRELEGRIADPLLLNADGTGTMSFGNDHENITWSSSGRRLYISTGEGIGYRVSGNQLFLDFGNTGIEFIYRRVR